MPFGIDRRTHRTLVQRLNDRRRRVALAGLAAGALVAAFFRRKESGGGSEVGEPMKVTEAPEPISPATPPEPGPDSAIGIPPAASEPAATEVAPDPSPPTDSIEAPAEAPATEAEPAPTAESPAAEPPTGELSAEEASILAVLAQSGRQDDDRTAIALATSLERETPEVASVLRKLGAEGVVSNDLRTAAGEEVWAVTERGVRRLGAQS